ncbi:hypothetical protein DMC47_17580 [Nostoc sp. 3335mG]|nr:hypothetical protein DMC47_17580 [Nostoc sp. 3335mG]
MVTKSRFGHSALFVVLAMGLSNCKQVNDGQNASKLPTVRANASQAANGNFRVVITGNGLHYGGDTNYESVADCAAFQLTPAQVKEFFARAETIDDRTYNHELNISQCYAKGVVWLANGEHGTWAIDKSRRGYYTRSDGTGKNMFCRDCSSALYLTVEDVTYDGADDNE